MVWRTGPAPTTTTRRGPLNHIEKIQQKIERTSAQRRSVLRVGRDPLRTQELDARLEELYAELRTAKARSRNGDRGKIIKQARVERELEKLMTV